MHGGEKARLKQDKLDMWQCDSFHLEQQPQVLDEFHVSSEEEPDLTGEMDSVDPEDPHIKLKLRKIVKQEGVFKTTPFKPRKIVKPPSRHSPEVVEAKKEYKKSKLPTGEKKKGFDINQKEMVTETNDDINANVNDAIQQQGGAPATVREERPSAEPMPEEKPLDLTVPMKLGNPVEVERAAAEMIPSYAQIVSKNLITSEKKQDTPVSSRCQQNATTVNVFQPSGDPASIPIFDIRRERDHLAKQLTESLQRNEELSKTLSCLSSSVNKMEERLFETEKEIANHGRTIDDVRRRLSLPDFPTMPTYVESLILNPDPSRLLRVEHTGSLHQMGKNELLFADSLLLMMQRIGNIIFDILRFHPANFLDAALSSNLSPEHELEYMAALLRPWMVIRDVHCFKDYAINFVRRADSLLASNPTIRTSFLLFETLTEEERKSPMFPKLFPLHSRSETYGELLASAKNKNAPIQGLWPPHLTRIDPGKFLCYLLPQHRSLARALLVPALNHGAMSQFLTFTWPFDGIRHRGKIYPFSSRLRCLRIHIHTLAAKIALQSLVPGTFNVHSNSDNKVFYDNTPWRLQTNLEWVQKEQNRTDVDAWTPQDFQSFFLANSPTKISAKVNAYPELNLHVVSKPPSIPYR